MKLSSNNIFHCYLLCAHLEVISVFLTSFSFYYYSFPNYFSSILIPFIEYNSLIHGGCHFYYLPAVLVLLLIPGSYSPSSMQYTGYYESICR